VLHWNGTKWRVQASPGQDDRTQLEGVSATSATDAWAVGEVFNGSVDRTLILHWNGTAWKVAKSPNVGPDYNDLYDVDASSTSNAYAVGETYKNGIQRLLILHWNGSKWAPQFPSQPGQGDTLEGVSTTSSSNVWAVGYSDDAALAIHCC
jgi:hypothetical protein